MKYNIGNLEKLLNFIKSNKPEHFDMEFWGQVCPYGIKKDIDLEDIFDSSFNLEDCDTTACVAGSAAILMREEGLKSSGKPYVVESIAQWLGIPHEEYNNYCEPCLFMFRDWPKLGAIGEIAHENAIKNGDYEGIMFLLQSMINFGKKGKYISEILSGKNPLIIDLQDLKTLDKFLEI